MRFSRFRLKLAVLLTASLLCLLSIASYAKDPDVLMLLWQGETNAEKGFKDALSEELSDQNINYKVLDADKNIDRLKDLLDSVDESEYKLIYSYGSTITSRAVKSFQKTPILFNIVFDPIGYKIIESWDKKGPNITGVSNSIPADLEIQKMHEIFGQGDIGFIYNPQSQDSVNEKEDMEVYLEKTGQKLLPFEFDKKFAPFRSYLNEIKGRVSCIYLPSERLLTQNIKRIFSEINRRNIPTCVTSKSYLTQGALLCMSADYYKIGRKAGKCASQILEGNKPIDLPILRPSETDIELYANVSIVKRLKTQFPKELDIIYVKE